MEKELIIDRGCGPEIAGTRITIYDILHYLDAGRDQATIAVVLRLSSEQVRAAIRYIEEHRDEVMAVHRQIEDRIAQGHPAEVQAKLDAAHARFVERVNQIRERKKQEANGAGDSRGH